MKTEGEASRVNVCVSVCGVERMEFQRICPLSTALLAANFSRKGDLFVGTLPCLNRRRTHGQRTAATISCHDYSEEDCPVQAMSITRRILFSRSFPYLLIITRNTQYQTRCNIYKPNLNHLSTGRYIDAYTDLPINFSSKTLSFAFSIRSLSIYTASGELTW